MDSTTKSVVTTLLTALLTTVAAWLVKNGFLVDGQQASFIEGAIGVLFAVGAAVLTWYKSREHTPENKVLAAQDLNGVQVVVGPTASTELKTLAASDANDLKLQQGGQP